MYPQSSISASPPPEPANSNDRLSGALIPPGNGRPRAELAARLRDQILPLALLFAGLAMAGLAGAHWTGAISLHAAVIGAALAFTLVGGAGILAAFRAAPARSPAQDAALAMLAARLESGLESLKDLQWELRESEARYRDLLDFQGNVILRRDREGLVSFVNDSFCETFGIERGEAVGQPFQPQVISGPDAAALPEPTLEKPRRYEQKIMTGVGERWFAWEEFAVADEAGQVREYQCVGRDVTQQREVEATLQDARNEAETANRAKSRFLASMSHEIRTPMNGILGMTGLLMDTQLSPEQSTYARAINSSAKTLLSLIDEILDFSKIEAGKLELAAAPFDLADAVQGVVELLAPRVHDKGLSIGWYLDPTLPVTVTGDEIRIRQILMNLLGNAIKFTDQGGVALEVTLRRFSDSGVEIDFAVRDTGMGIAPSALDGIFSEFEQADATPARRHGGTGLGLAISKRLVEKMKGRLSVESEVGKGSCFTARIPLGAPDFGPALRDRWPMPSEPRRVLLVAPEMEAGATARLLQDAGCSVTRAAAGEAGVEIWDAAKRGEPFDALIVCVDAFRQGDGLPAQARDALASRGTLTAIVLIDPSRRGEIANLKAQGFDAYLVRPVRPASLFAQLHGSAVPSGEAAARGAPRLAAVGGTSPAVKPRNRRILLAEDNEINALLARKMLEKAGCEVVHARNGREAAEAAARALGGDSAFDLILMDIHMPEMDGVEAARRIRADHAAAGDGRRRPPIVALTANAFPEDREQYLDAGLEDYLAKPFEKEDLEAILSKWTDEPIGKVKTSAALSG